MSWSLRHVIGYWLWWRNHRLTAQDRCRPALDFPEYLQWVRQDLEIQRKANDDGLWMIPSH